MDDENCAPAVQLVYDRECPFCEFYCQSVRIRESIGNLKIVDAREDSEIMRRITSNGLDIDQGMVLQVGEQLFYDADAIHALALMSSRSGSFNRLNYWIFRSAALSGLIYPVLRLLRHLALKLMRKTKINNLSKPGNSRF